MSGSEEFSSDDIDPREVALVQQARLSLGGDDVAPAPSNPRRKRPAIENQIALEEKIREIALPTQWPWLETLSVTTPTPLELKDVHDDLEREATFYQHTLRNVKQAILQLDQSGIPYQRPRDFFAEMVKSDAHMNKVKDVLLREKKRIEAVTERRRQQDIKKYSKQVHAHRVQERAKQKKQEQTDISKWKTERHAKIGDAEDVPDEQKLEDILQSASKKKSPKSKSTDWKMSSKRTYKDSKFGFGGQKRRMKSNDASSTADMSDFSNRKNKAPAFFQSKKKDRLKKPSRPGKNKRMQMRTDKGKK